MEGESNPFGAVADESEESQVAQGEVEGGEEVPEEAPAFQPDMKTIEWMQKNMQGQQPTQYAQQPSQPQLTQEQINQALAVPQISADLAQSLFGEDFTDGQLKALQNFADMISNHARTVSGLTGRYVSQSLGSRLAPIEQQATQAQLREFGQDVLKTAPALKQYGAFVSQIISQMAQEDGPHQSLPYEGQIQSVIERAAAQISQFVPGFNPKAKGASSATSTNQMASMASPGGSGSAPSQPEPSGKDAWKAALAPLNR